MTVPRLHATTTDVLDLDVDAIVVPVLRGALETPGAHSVLAALGLDEVPRDATFRGRVGETLHLAAPGLRCRRVVLVGIGRIDGLDHEVLRRAAGAATRALAEDVTTVATTLTTVTPDVAAVRAVAEGALLGAYRFVEHRSRPTLPTLADVTVVVPSSLEDIADAALRRATVHAAAQITARDLVNQPPGHQSPEAFCSAARDIAGGHAEVEVWDVDRLRDEGCGGVLGVGLGSSRPPRMLILRHRPERPIASVALVGKGITFDSGGLSLKRPYPVMTDMKSDMAGAAAVVATVGALADLDVPVEVLGVCGVAENLPSGSALRPGDVITTRDGTTVEVRNTDAEGRLVLADALAYAAEQDPDAIIDVATLTGAALAAVGARATGLFGNDDDLLRQVLRAADAAGEPTWHLPLWDDLRPNLDADVADLNNLGTGDHAGATMGALFLREFVDDTPWVHLDIAGASFAEEARHHLPKGGTGTAVRTLLRWLEQSIG